MCVCVVWSLFQITGELHHRWVGAWRNLINTNAEKSLCGGGGAWHGSVKSQLLQKYDDSTEIGVCGTGQIDARAVDPAISSSNMATDSKRKAVRHPSYDQVV